MIEKKFTYILMVLAVVGLGLHSYKYYNDSKIYFGENAEIITQVKDEDFYTKKAITYLKDNDIDVPQEYNMSVSTTQDDAGYAFLQRALGKENVFEYAKQNKLDLNTHVVRFYKQYEKKEIFIYLNSESGKVNGFDEILREDEKRNNVESDVAAEALAVSFLQKQGVNSLALEKQEYNKEQKNERVDHVFQFKEKQSSVNTQYGEGYIELVVVVSGDRVSGFKKYIFIPENFGREMSDNFSMGDFLALLSMFVSSLMALFAIVICIKAFSEKKANFKIFSSVFALLVVFSLFANLDSLKIILSSYPTDQNFNIFLWTTIISAVTYSLAAPVIIFMSGVSGKYLDEKINHNKLSDGKNLNESVFKGYLIALLSLGVTVIIYTLGEKYFDVWQYGAPNGFGSTLYIFPLLSVVYLGMSSSVGEEIIFRYFGYLFFKKYLKNTFFAMLVITIIWAIGHSNYPVFPVYFRGIELVIGGMIWAFFILRYNLLTTITAHYVFNVILFATPLILTNSPFMVINGIFALVFPIIFIYIYKFTLKYFKSYIH